MEKAYREHGDVLAEMRQSDGSVKEDASEGERTHETMHAEV